MHKKIFALVLFVIFSIAIFGCGGARKAIQIKGSDTMVNLTQAWAEAFMKINPTVSLAITGGGSGTGIAALINSSTDIAQCSRDMEKKELGMARNKGVNPFQIHVANDGITLIVNKSNPVSRLTIQQLSDIFSGKIKNWKEVGGPNKNIVALSRERNSGTHVFFLEHVVKLGDKKNSREFSPSVLMMPSSQAIVEEIIGNSSAIGYVGLGYLTDREKALVISRDGRSPYVEPTVKTVLNKQYPISRALYFYTNCEPSGEVKSFIDFVLSEEGQKIVLKMDFVPVK